MRRTPLVFVGLGATALGVFAGYIVIVATALDCGGSDVAPPSESEACKTGAAMTRAWLGLGALVAAPLVGLALSLVLNRWAPLVGAIAAAFIGFNLWFWGGG
ncbi:MAG TPA: hypothetical protein VG144_04345 [Gaiellaceae bacterium]|nr:hypothetical protein [Gaiellaceae bacterium]